MGEKMPDNENSYYKVCEIDEIIFVVSRGSDKKVHENMFTHLEIKEKSIKLKSIDDSDIEIQNFCKGI